MLQIFCYSFYDLIRGRWGLIYLLFFLLLSLSLLMLTPDLSRVVLTLMNVILILCPLIATLFGVMYYYNSREFVELLLAQPIRRPAIFLGQYLGLAASLSVSFALGVGIPFLVYGLLRSSAIANFTVLIFSGILLTFIFSGLAYYLALRHENRIKGFGMAIVAWLFFAIIYDGIFLLALIVFRHYPLENAAIAGTLFNPIDLSRILVLLKLEVSALMGYTGAVFQNFFGAGLGMVISLLALLLWCVAPLWAIRRRAMRQDF